MLHAQELGKVRQAITELLAELGEGRLDSLDLFILVGVYATIRAQNHSVAMYSIRTHHDRLL